MKQPTYYITTPIYYPNDKLHIGHSYCSVAADTMARYKKMRGFDVRFLTGTDEHGLKIERKAAELGMLPLAYLDGIIAWIKDLWAMLDVEYDDFIRTTDNKHVKAVQKIFKKLFDQGDIYKGKYEGLYCVPCEAFFTESQLTKERLCPDCGRPLEQASEEAYFLKLSKYQDRLTRYIEEHPDFITPQSRRNEMVNNFLKPGLEDLCVSRTSFKWGIPVDFDPDHIVYVWLDALSNYVTALGYLSDDDADYQKYWPADLHLVGKEIIRFHTIIWPIILMALEQPLPKQVFGHGWLLIGNAKMSKSVGNVVDPKVLVNRYGVDAIRYFLMREIAFGQDGNFTNELLLQRMNADLANDLGNLLSRIVGMIDKYFGGVLPAEQAPTPYDEEVEAVVQTAVSQYAARMDALLFHEALAETWQIIRRANKYIDETQPWVLAKDETKKAALAGVLYVLSEALRIVAVLISPVMPNTPAVIRAQLNITDEALMTWESVQTFGLLPRTVAITKGAAAFPRIDIAQELLALQPDAPEQPAEQSDGKAESGAAQKTKPSKTKEQGKESSELTGMITIDDFARVQLKTGTVIACEKLEGSDKLLKSMIRVGEETRQIVSGIAAHYQPEAMVGKTVVVVTNLKPVKLRGVLSEGMILAASDEAGNLNIVTVDGAIGGGAVVR